MLVTLTALEDDNIEQKSINKQSDVGNKYKHDISRSKTFSPTLTGFICIIYKYEKEQLYNTDMDFVFKPISKQFKIYILILGFLIYYSDPGLNIKHF